MNYNLIANLTILYVNEDLSESNTELNTLRQYNKKILTANCVNEAFRLYEEYHPCVVITDVKLQGKSGLKLAKKIREENAYQALIVKTNNNKKKYMLKALDLQVDSYLVCPIAPNDLLDKIYYVGQKYTYRQKNIEKRELLQSILDHQSGLVLLTNFENITYCSNSFLDFFSIKSAQDIFERFESLLDLFIKHDNYLNANTKEEFLDKFYKAKAIDKVVLMVGKSFTPKAFHIEINPLISGKDELYILTLTNISIMQEKSIEISYKAYRDTLTGVYNRNKFEEVFEYEFQRFKRYNQSLSIATLDIDHFKRFNDTYGHLIGDEVLKMLAQLIDKNVRKIDLFARWGGEEFVLLMPETTQEEAFKLCEKLRAMVETLEHPTAGRISCSIGVTQAMDDDNLTSIFKRCDEALYNAKANGRNRVEQL